MSFVSCVASVDGKVNYSGVQKDQGVTFNINPPRPSLDESGPEVWMISERFGLVGQGYLKCGHTIRLFNASLPFAFTLQASMCFFYFVNTANLLYVHPNRHNMDCFIRFY